MFKFLRKINNNHYSIKYKKPETLENNEYVDKKLVTIQPISAAEISEYDIENIIASTHPL